MKNIIIYENFKSDFCVYVFLNPSKPGKYEYDNIKFDYEPIYVGKGKINRPKNHLYRYKNGNSYFYNKLKKIIGYGFEPIWIIVKNGLSESDAFIEEMRLIKIIGKKLKGGPLTNLSDGGEGQTGFKHSEDTKNKISNSIKSNEKWLNMMKSKEYRDKLSKSLMGHEGYGKGVPRKQEVKDKIRNSVMGINNPFSGKTHSEELKNKMSVNNSGKNNPNSKVYTIKHLDEVMRFEGRKELKDYLDIYNKENNLKGPSRVSFDSLINRGVSKDFELISIEKIK
jgi:hypothetical protein